jgi:type VI protein secretion system component VasK
MFTLVMYQLFMYVLCLLLFFRGLQMLQFAITEVQPVKSWRAWTLAIGIGGFVLATVLAALLAYQFMLQGLELQRTVEEMMKQPPAQPQQQAPPVRREPPL